jgi:hypothetical protein
MILLRIQVDEIARSLVNKANNADQLMPILNQIDAISDNGNNRTHLTHYFRYNDTDLWRELQKHPDPAIKEKMSRIAKKFNPNNSAPHMWDLLKASDSAQKEKKKRPTANAGQKRPASKVFIAPVPIQKITTNVERHQNPFALTIHPLPFLFVHTLGQDNAKQKIRKESLTPYALTEEEVKAVNVLVSLKKPGQS